MKNLPNIYSQTSISEVRKKYGDAVSLMKLFSPDKQYLYCRDVPRCFTGTAPTLRKVEMTYGKSTAKKWLEIQLWDLSEYSGAEKMSIQMADRTADIFLIEFSFLKLTEWMLFFHRFKSGRYCQFYGRVDNIQIAVSLQKFLLERESERSLYYHEKEEEERRLFLEKSKSEAMPLEELKKAIDEGKFPNLKKFGLNNILKNE